MKAELHIPTETYGYIELSIEGTLEEIINTYYELKERLSEKQAVIIKDTNNNDW